MQANLIVFACIMALGYLTQEASARADWVGYKNEYYVAVYTNHDTVSWDEALYYCESPTWIGSTLASIHSVTDNENAIDALTHAVSTAPDYDDNSSSNKLSGFGGWFGLHTKENEEENEEENEQEEETDTSKHKEYVFTDGTDVIYTNFMFNRGNSSHNNKNNNKGCIGLIVSDGIWKNMECPEQRLKGFICNKPEGWTNANEYIYYNSLNSYKSNNKNNNKNGNYVDAGSNRMMFSYFDTKTWALLGLIVAVGVLGSVLLGKKSQKCWEYGGSNGTKEEYAAIVDDSGNYTTVYTV